MIKYLTGNLFNLAPSGSYLAHACNCQGLWKSGIAAEFYARYPTDYEEYKNFCARSSACNYEDKPALGKGLVTSNKVICLMTSWDYGPRKDPVSTIILSTELALLDLTDQLPPNAVVYSPKINSGLFAVPWETTEYVLNQFLIHQRPDISWTVIHYA